MTDSGRKQSQAATEKENVLDKLDGHDALLILKALASEDQSIAKRIEQIALEYLRSVDVEDIASQVYSTLESLEVEDLWDQSGGTRYGYVEPSERACEMFEEALETFTDELNKYLDLSLDKEAKNYCMGILKGIDRFNRESRNQFKDWAEDAPFELSERILDDWKKACKTPELMQEMEDFVERDLRS